MVEPEELVRLARAMNCEKKLLQAWMKAEAMEGRLRTNSESPYWDGYKSARDALNEAIATIE